LSGAFTTLAVAALLPPSPNYFGGQRMKETNGEVMVSFFLNTVKVDAL
jgi:hypothetical protein